MSLTIRDCLQLPSLSMGTVIGGHSGLDNIVNTISVVEFDYYDDNFYTPNELLITAFYSVRDSVTEQCLALEEYKRSGDVGLVLFYMDTILKTLSPQVIEVADRLSFPIIALPEENMGLRYSDVISDVMEAVFIEKKNNNFFVNNTMERISQLSEENRNITTVLSFASAYTKASFFLCDDKNNLMAASYWPFTNKTDFNLILNAEVADAQQNIYKLPFTSKSGIRLKLYGASKNDKLNTRVMNEVIEVIQLFAVIWNYNLNISTREAIIPALIEGDTELAKTIGLEQSVDMRLLNTAIFMALDEEETQNEKRKNIVLDIRKIISQNTANGIVDLFGNLVIIICSYSKRVAMEEIFFSELEAYLNIAEGKAHYTVFTRLKLSESLKSVYLEYYSAIKTAEKVYPSKRRFTESEISFADKCKKTINSIDNKKEEYLSMLEPILEDPEEDLMLTLSTYLLDAGSEVKRTAELLFVHRNTVRYRLSKVKNLLDLDFSKMPVAYEVYFAVAIFRVIRAGR